MSNRCTVDGATIDYTDSGTGPVVVFVHGVYVTGAIWDRVIDALGYQVRSIAPTWPLGAHHPVPDGVDLGAAAAARRVVRLLQVLDLRDVTLVANDTGGGLVLSALGDPSLELDRITRLVFTNCDSYEHFPPGQFRYVARLCRVSPALGRALLKGLTTKLGQAVFLKAVCRRPLDPPERSAVFGEFLTNSASRRQAVTLTASLDPALTLGAAPAIKKFRGRVTVVWGTDDALFPLDHARRLAGDFPNADLVEVPGSLTYVMLDAPDIVARAVLSTVDAR
jgi:pimeloyl-ACP methyl ester carboxylesterase